MTSNSRLFVLLLSAILRIDFVLSDYPPESENGHSYYNPYHSGTNNRGASSSSSSRSVTARNRGGTSFVGDWTDRDWQVLSTYDQPKCVDIPWNLTLCRNIGYTQMRLPNLLEHEDMKEVTQQAASWVRLTHIGCHADAQIFLCSLFAPVCLDQPVWPCQTLCEAVKTGCERKMLQYGFPWPDMLRCDKFPSSTKTKLCMETRSNQEIENDADSSCSSCSLPESVDAVIASLCQSDFVIRAKVKQRLVNGTDLKIVVSRKKKIYRTGTLRAKDLKEGAVFIEGGARCRCPPVPEDGGRRAADDHVIIAGNRTADNRLTVSFIQNVRSKSLRPILRDLRRKDACRPGRNSKGKKQNKKNQKKMKSTTTTTTMESPRSSEEREITNPGTKTGKKKKQKTGKIQNKESSKLIDPPARNSSDVFVATKATRKANRKASKAPEGQREIEGATGAPLSPTMQREKVTTSLPRPTRKPTHHRRRPVVVSTEPEPES